MKPTIYVFRAPPGDTRPELIETATLDRDRVVCRDDRLRQWIQSAIDTLLSVEPPPRSAEDWHELIEKVCVLRWSRHTFCSPTPFP